MIWLLIAHVLVWFFIVWFVKLAVLLVTKQNTRMPLFWTASVFGCFSVLLHYALHKVAGVPLIV